MSGRVEKLLKAYPEMIQKRDCLAYQLAHFKGVSAEDVIASMMTPKVDGERVKSSNLSDKTAQIALEYREKQARMNREWYAYLEKQLQDATEEIKFIESAVAALPNPLSELMLDVLKGHLTWEQLAEKHHLSRATVGRYKKRAIAQLNVLLEEHEHELEAYLLS